MRVMLKGVHTSKKRLADGTVKTYFYAWKGGPRIMSAPGTPAFNAEYAKHVQSTKAPDTDIMGGLIALYKKNELPRKESATRRSYYPIIKKIEDEFGDMPVAAIEERGSRKVFLEWRQTMAHTPRAADMAWSVLQRILSYAYDLELITRNPCEKAGRLAKKGTRRENIWLPVNLAAMKECAPAHVYDVLLMAIWTGQRQGDMLRLTWANYDGTHIRLKQSKGGKRVTVKASDDLKEMLDGRKAALAGKEIAAMTILTTSRGKPWTSDGFRASWATAAQKANVTGLTFHDLRGTFISLAHKAGASVEDIASISGHSISDVKSILEMYYLADNHGASDSVILRMERKGK